MYDYIKGILVHASPISVTLETSGIGYKIFIPTTLYGTLPQIGSELHLYTTFVVRDISQTLYGFLSIEERALFEEVITVSGIGPKIGLSVIGHLSSAKLQHAIQTNDIQAISKVPGIGKKTAQRLIIDLRDRFGDVGTGHLPSEFSIQIKSTPEAQKIGDAMNALINLGYNQQTAQKAIKKSLDQSGESIDLPTLITNSLKNV